MEFLGHEILRPSYIPMTGWLRHGPFAMWLVKAARPGRIVELGSHYGYSYFAFCEAALASKLTLECIAVDTWKGDEHAGLYGEDVYQAVLTENRKYAQFSTLLRKTFSAALNDVEDNSVDILHVDGRHFYDDVKYDYETWIPKLKKDAIVLFHDTMVRENGFGVWKYWEELSRGNATFNFPYQHGLGVLFRGQDLTPEMSRFRELTQTEAGRQALTATFFEAGEALALDCTLSELSRRALHGEQAVQEFIDLLGSENIQPESQYVRLSPGAAAVARTMLETAAGFSTPNELDGKKKEQTPAELLDNLELRRDLAYARSRAHRMLKEYFVHKITLKLSETRLLPLSDRTRAKLGRSAAKRDPRRSLLNAQGQPAEFALTTSLALSANDRGKMKVIKGALDRDPDKPDILLVSHEASWTGAPILVQNLAREFSDRYNVSIICVRNDGEGGALLQPLLDVSTGVVLLNDTLHPGNNIWKQVSSYLGRNKFEFAIINSIESRSMAPLLQLADVPAVALVHEFATYTLPTTAFSELMRAVDYTVFSTSATLETANETTGLSPTPNVRIIPQGKSNVPVGNDRADVRERERARLKALLRPAGTEDDFLVLGAGTVQLRKGVDLFIEIARKVLESPDGRKVRFVWIGSGYDPNNDATYSIFLLDQLRRARIDDRVTILPSTHEIEYAYELSDALLLSSRVDPLPNVCIDAMFLGLPVLCFDRASGMAEILRNGGVGKSCVAEYMDSSDLARLLIDVIASPECYDALSRRMKEIAIETFDLPRYARQIEDLAQAAIARRRNRAEDIKTIAASGHFDPDLMAPAGTVFDSREDAARVYLEYYAMGPFGRRPEPGFNPHVYAEKLVNDTGLPLRTDPYAEFLRAARPNGPWLTQVLDTSGPAPAMSGGRSLRAALHIHAYYVDELHRLFGHLNANVIRPALFVSVNNERSKKYVEDFLGSYKGDSDVRIVPNAGRDIGPLLTEFGRDLVDNFDILGHVHTKRSEQVYDQIVVEKWVHFLFENMLGGKDGGAMVDKMLNAFSEDPKLGIVYASDPNLIGWTRNWHHAQALSRRLNIGMPPQAFDFPVGTMFWMRSEALRPFIDLGLQWQDYPREPIDMDGTVLHALERLFGIVPLHFGFHAAVTSIKGVTR